jgi:hypothetical protein
MKGNTNGGNSSVAESIEKKKKRIFREKKRI